MNIESVRNFFAWCSLINMGLLLFWLVWLRFLHDFVYSVHGKWFNLSVEEFNGIHYRGMLHFKMGIFLFNIVPYLALRIIG